MNKTLELLKTPFESSSQRTPEWMSFARTFRNEIKQELKRDLKITEFKFSIGHFYCSGFFKLPDNRIYYWSISDVRWFNDGNMLIRTAKGFDDYSGGSNNFIKIEPGMFKKSRLPN